MAYIEQQSGEYHVMDAMHSMLLGAVLLSPWAENIPFTRIRSWAAERVAKNLYQAGGNRSFYDREIMAMAFDRTFKQCLRILKPRP